MHLAVLYLLDFVLPIPLKINPTTMAINSVAIPNINSAFIRPHSLSDYFLIMMYLLVKRAKHFWGMHLHLLAAEP